MKGINISLVSVLLFISCCVGIGKSQAASPIWATPELTVLINEGLAGNKALKSMALKAESLREMIPAQGALPDPVLGLAVLNLPTDSFRFDEQPMTQKQITVGQKFPWFGKLGLQSDKSALIAERYELQVTAKQLELSKNIADLYYSLGIVKEGLKTNDQLTELVAQIGQIAESRYSTGRGPQQDIFQAQVELARLKDEEIRLKNRYQTLELNLNRVLNRVRFIAIDAPAGLKELNLSLDRAKLTSFALTNNPQLQEKKIEKEIFKVDVHIADKAYWPDVDVKLSYGQRDEDMTGKDLADFVSASVSIPIPIWQRTKQDKKRASAESALRSVENEYQNILETLPFTIDSLVTEIEALQENYHIYKRTLIVQADQWARSSLAEYEVGKIEFNTMINAQLRLLKFDLQAETYLFNIYQKRAELEEILGSSLDRQSIQ